MREVGTLVRIVTRTVLWQPGHPNNGEARVCPGDVCLVMGEVEGTMLYAQILSPEGKIGVIMPLSGTSELLS